MFHPNSLLVVFSVSILLSLIFVASFAPWLDLGDPLTLDPGNRLLSPREGTFFGTDQFGRDVLSRALHGSQASLVIALGVVLASVSTGALVGILAGYFSIIDGIFMRIMDGIMAIPGVLLAIALVALTGGGRLELILAITVPEIPRVARLVRSIVLSVRQEPYVEAAISVGTRLPQLLWRHVLPNCLAPLMVQAVYIAGAAMLTEAILSFLGAGMPPEIPSWGNMMAEGRAFFPLAPWVVLFPGLFLTMTILSINVLGDLLREAFDPKLKRIISGT